MWSTPADAAFISDAWDHLVAGAGADKLTPAARALIPPHGGRASIDKLLGEPISKVVAFVADANARAWAALGYAPIPLGYATSAKSKESGLLEELPSDGKTPAIGCRHGAGAHLPPGFESSSLKAAKLEPWQARKSWARACGVGIVAGASSPRLVLVDIDRADHPATAALVSRLPPGAMTCATGPGKQHVYFGDATGYPITGEGKLAVEDDGEVYSIRRGAMYLVAPGSYRGSAKDGSGQWRWNPLPPVIMAASELPQLGPDFGSFLDSIVKPKAKPKASAPARQQSQQSPTWVRDKLASWGVQVVSEGEDGGRHRLEVECPWSSEHTGGTSTGFVYDEAPYTFHCFHSHCSSRTWADFRGRFEVAPSPPPRQRPRQDSAVDLEPVGAELYPSRPFDLAQTIVDVNRSRLKFWRGEWWRWKGTHWTPDLPALRQLVALSVELSSIPASEDKPSRPYPATRAARADMLDAMQVVCEVDDSTAEHWKGGVSTGWDDADIIPTPGGYMHASSRQLIPAEPSFFAPAHLGTTPLDLDTPHWLAFLASLQLDVDEVCTLQEMMGYLISRDTWAQKAFMLIGLARSGKGTILSLLKAIVNSGWAGTDPSELGGDFGLASLRGKQLAILDDIRDWGGEDSKRCTQRILTITGEGSPNIQRKGTTTVADERLPVRFILSSNVVPRFQDQSAVIARRFIAIHINVSFLGREDHGLLARLMGELPGVAWWALCGLRRLREAGRFTDSARGAALLEAVADLASPLDSWLRDCTEPSGRATRAELWASWERWAQANRSAVGSQMKLYADLTSRGFEEKKSDGVRLFLGLSVKRPVDPVPAPWHP